MKRIYRSKTNKILGGVIGGLGNYLKFDPSILRCIYIFLGLLTGFFPLLIIYIIAVLVIPLEPKGYVVPKYKKLHRSIENRKIAGVCGGISEFFKVDVTLVRLLFIILCVITAFIPLLVSYIIAWLIIPEKHHKDAIIEIEVDD